VIQSFLNGILTFMYNLKIIIKFFALNGYQLKILKTFIIHNIKNHLIFLTFDSLCCETEKLEAHCYNKKYLKPPLAIRNMRMPPKNVHPSNCFQKSQQKKIKIIIEMRVIVIFHHQVKQTRCKTR
jgi:hypothetical protein